MIQEETRRLSRLVDNLLDLSRLEAGAAEPRREWTSVEELIRRGARGARRRGRGRSRLSIDRDLPLVSVDPVQMERAFVNVLENARRHSGGHPVSVRARAVRSLAGAPPARGAGDGAAAAGAGEPAGDRVIVRIVDRGPGHPARRSSSACSSPSTAPARPAAGTAARASAWRSRAGFTEANGGTLHVESLPGQGATFVFELPLRRAEPRRRRRRRRSRRRATTARPPARGRPPAPRRRAGVG